MGCCVFGNSSKEDICWRVKGCFIWVLDDFNYKFNFNNLYGNIVRNIKKVISNWDKKEGFFGNIRSIIGWDCCYYIEDKGCGKVNRDFKSIYCSKG